MNSLDSLGTIRVYIPPLVVIFIQLAIGARLILHLCIRYFGLLWPLIFLHL